MKRFVMVRKRYIILLWTRISEAPSSSGENGLTAMVKQDTLIQQLGLTSKCKILIFYSLFLEVYVIVDSQ